MSVGGFGVSEGDCGVSGRDCGIPHRLYHVPDNLQITVLGDGQGILLIVFKPVWAENSVLTVANPRSTFRAV